MFAFDSPLVCGTLINRYKRFLADVALEDGTIITAHCANSGSMKTLLMENAPVYLSPNTNPKAKLDWRWEIVDVGTSLVGINTARPNHIVASAISRGNIPELHGYAHLKQEVTYGKNSRIDILLNDTNKGTCYVEVKNATMSRTAGIVEFPDGVTARGAKHLQELSNMVADGHRAVMVYLVNRTDCDVFTIAKDIDPMYYKHFVQACNAGVEAIAYKVYIDPQSGIDIDSPVALEV